MNLPSRIAESPWAERVRVAVLATTSVGPALLALRGQTQGREADDGQLKTAVDEAAEGWVLGFLRSAFPGDAILAEETYEREGSWTPTDRFWTVDALDGTRSFVDGYDGFCSQLAFVEGGRPVVGVIAEPVTGRCYLGVENAGAYRIEPDGSATELSIQPPSGAPRFVDSTVPKGPVGELMRSLHGTFVECGSVGLKICRVAEGEADVFAKAFAFKLWDIAPGDIIVREAGGALTDWGGAAFAYAQREVRFGHLLCAARASTSRLSSMLTETRDG